jgi:hypothetical protein
VCRRRGLFAAARFAGARVIFHMTGYQRQIARFTFRRAVRLGVEVALIDNQAMRGLRLQANQHRKRRALQWLKELPRNALGSQARMLFGQMYDRYVDFSASPDGTVSNEPSPKA